MTAPGEHQRDESRLARWQRVTDWPLMVAAATFLMVYAVPIIAPQIGPGAQRLCWWAQCGCWALFAVDYGARLALVGRRSRWFVRHLPDLAVIVLPMLRPLRLLRVVTFLNVANRSATSTLRGRVATYVVGGAALLSFVAAVAALDAERGQVGATISSFGDAWWWAIATMTTVGYGDRYPVTTTGRFVAVGLMIGGIALLGTVTASLASWLSDRVREDTDTNAEILTELRQVRVLLEQQREHPHT